MNRGGVLETPSACAQTREPAVTCTTSWMTESLHAILKLAVRPHPVREQNTDSHQYHAADEG